MTTLRTSTLPLVTLVTVALLGCVDRRAWTRVDPWYAPSPTGSSNGRELDTSDVFVVAEAYRDEAGALLETTPAIEIDRQRAARWVGVGMPEMDDRRPVLVRGVYLNPGHFSVREADGHLYVHAGCLGRRAVPMKRQPLVVLLREVPREVYVTCSMAE